MYEERVLDNLIDEVIAGRPVPGDDPLAEIAGKVLSLNELCPRPEAKAASRDLMLARAGQATARTPARTWLRRRLTAIVASGMALTMASTGTVYAASSSLPGDLLYPVKEATENVGLALTASGQARAQAQIRLARVRLAEIKALMLRKDKRRIGLAVRALNRRLALARSERGLSPAEARQIMAVVESLRRSTTRSLTPLPGSRLNRNRAAARGLIKKHAPAAALNRNAAPAPDQEEPRTGVGSPRTDAPAVAPKRRAVTPSQEVVNPSPKGLLTIMRDRLRLQKSE